MWYIYGLYIYNFVFWYCSFFLVSCCSRFLFFWFLVLLAIAGKKNNELENKKQKTKNPPKKTRLHTPRGGVVAESWVLSFFLFFWFLVFIVFVFCFFCFWFLVLFSHCTKTKQKVQKLSIVAKQWENHGTCAVSVVLECSENPHSQGVPFWKNMYW